MSEVFLLSLLLGFSPEDVDAILGFQINYNLFEGITVDIYPKAVLEEKRIQNKSSRF